MHKPLVSVITTVYNCERYIKSSLESVLNQTFQDFELILVNDGSTDKTWDIACSFDDPRIVFCNNNENRHIPLRRNEAIELSKGELLAVHDGDDESLPGRLAQQVDFMKENPNIFCLGGHAIKIDTRGEVTGIMNYPPAGYSGIVESYYRGKNPIIDPTSMFRKADFIELGCYSLDPDIFTVQDFDLWGRAILAGKKFENMQFPLIRYRVNPEGVTRKRQSEMISAHVKVVVRFHSELAAKKISEPGKG